jgi:hypothetical protein
LVLQARTRPVWQRMPLEIQTITPRRVDRNCAVFTLLIFLLVLPTMVFGLRVAFFQTSLQLQWDTPKGKAHCTSYGTREYTARLWNVPIIYDRLWACRETPIVIHNVTLKRPIYCKDLVRGKLLSRRPKLISSHQGLGDGVIGHWLVDFDEPECMPHWGGFVDLVSSIISVASFNTDDCYRDVLGPVLVYAYVHNILRFQPHSCQSSV